MSGRWEGASHGRSARGTRAHRVLYRVTLAFALCVSLPIPPVGWRAANETRLFAPLQDVKKEVLPEYDVKYGGVDGLLKSGSPLSACLASPCHMAPLPLTHALHALLRHQSARSTDSRGRQTQLQLLVAQTITVQQQCAACADIRRALTHCVWLACVCVGWRAGMRMCRVRACPLQGPQCQGRAGCE